MLNRLSLIKDSFIRIWYIIIGIGIIVGLIGLQMNYYNLNFIESLEWESVLIGIFPILIGGLFGMVLRILWIFNSWWGGEEIGGEMNMTSRRVIKEVMKEMSKNKNAYVKKSEYQKVVEE